VLHANACDTARGEDTAAAVLGGEHNTNYAAHGVHRRQLVGSILHAAGVLSDGTLARQTASTIRSVSAPKGIGTHALTTSCACQPLQSAVAFSSVAALLGSPGQSNYAAANAALDGTARQMLLRGVPAISVQWGEWGGGGMATAGETSGPSHKKTRRDVGMSALSPAAGLFALEALLLAVSAPPQGPSGKTLKS
jgi:NAD(P)-dependent dehydrogenase (short-subunit alcohol dehydrogenase family)